MALDLTVVDSECEEAMVARVEDLAVAIEVDMVALLAGSKIAAGAATSGDHEVATATVGVMDVDGEETVVEDVADTVPRGHSGAAMATKADVEDTVAAEGDHQAMVVELTTADEEGRQEVMGVEEDTRADTVPRAEEAMDPTKAEDGDRNAAAVEVATAGGARAGTLIEHESTRKRRKWL